MMKKIIVSFFLSIFVFLSVEFYLYFNVFSKGCSFKDYLNTMVLTISADEYFNKLYNRERVFYAYNPSFEEDKNVNSKLKPILFIGCSFTRGDGLTNIDENISAKTAKYTGRPVYNRSGGGWGLSQLVYQLRRTDLMSKIPEPEYLVYTFISDHLSRIYSYKIHPAAGEFQPHYEFDKECNCLYEKNPSLIDYSLIRGIYLNNVYYKSPILQQKKKETIRIYFNEAYKSMRKYWKNTKFVILLYPTDIDSDILHSNVWNDLDGDFIVIDVNNLTKKKMEEYVCSDGVHPSSQAWDIILPALFEYLNIGFTNTEL